jgi:hypothetical protein
VRRGPPLRHALGHPVLAPPGDAAGRRPRHDPVDPELGGEVDRQRAAVALRQRLDQHELRIRNRDLEPRHDGHAEAVGTRAHDVALGDGALAVADPHPLAGREPEHLDRVPPLGAVDEQLVGLGQVGHQEHRRTPQLGDGRAGGRHLSAR